MLPFTTELAPFTISVPPVTSTGPSLSYRPGLVPLFWIFSVIVPPGESTQTKLPLDTVPAALITRLAALPLWWICPWLPPLLFASNVMVPAALPVRSTVLPLAKVKLLVASVQSVRLTVSLVPNVSVSPVMLLLVRFQTTPEPTVMVLPLAVMPVKVMVVDGPFTMKGLSVVVPLLAMSVLPAGTRMVSVGSEGRPMGLQFCGTEAE